MKSQPSTLQTLKGFRDFLPQEKRKRNFVEKRVKEIFEVYGFEPLETPTLEYASLLLGKYGREADKLVYTFRDRGDRELALRYDQTVPTARVLAQYQTVLPKYFRRYQIQNVFRADKPQKGRYREFTQCDLDIFNSTSPLSDAEIIAATYFAYKNVGYPKVKIIINDRQVLFTNLKPYEKKIDIFSLIQTLDKLEKIGKETVIAELEKKGLAKNKASEAIEAISKALPSENLKKIIEYSSQLGVPKDDLEFQPTLARGLDYYTGMIFEVILTGYEGGSCGGGGRYDKLIEQIGGPSIPAVGIAFGFDRMVEAADNFKIIPATSGETKVLVTIFDTGTVINSLALASTLRSKKIKTELYPAVENLEKQLKYADKKGIPYVIIVGPDEVKNGVVRLKNMKTREQKNVKTSQLVNQFTS